MKAPGNKINAKRLEHQPYCRLNLSVLITGRQSPADCAICGPRAAQVHWLTARRFRTTLENFSAEEAPSLAPTCIRLSWQVSSGTLFLGNDQMLRCSGQAFSASAIRRSVTATYREGDGRRWKFHIVLYYRLGHAIHLPAGGRPTGILVLPACCLVASPTGGCYP